MGRELIAIKHGVALVLAIVGARALVIALHHGGFVSSPVREIQRATTFTAGGGRHTDVTHLFVRKWLTGIRARRYFQFSHGNLFLEILYGFKATCFHHVCPVGYYVAVVLQAAKICV